MISFFKKRTLKNLFSKYISEDEINLILNNDESLFNLKEQNVYFILIKIKTVVENGKTPILSDIINISSEHEAFLENIMGPIVLLSYGPLTSALSLDKKHNLISALTKSHKASLAIVHGEQKAYVGNIGNDSRLSYGTILNDISSILVELGNLKYGDIKEIKQA